MTQGQIILGLASQQKRAVACSWRRLACLTSSPGLMSCTALTSATVPLYVTITFGLQLWFIRATLPQETTTKHLTTIKYLTSWDHSNGCDFYEPYSGNTADPKWDSSSSSMVKPLQFTCGVKREELACGWDGAGAQTVPSINVMDAKTWNFPQLEYMGWKIFYDWFLKTHSTFILPWNIKC